MRACNGKGPNKQSNGTANDSYLGSKAAQSNAQVKKKVGCYLHDHRWTCMYPRTLNRAIATTSNFIHVLAGT